MSNLPQTVPPQQRGITLLVVMVMLVVIGLVSVSAMRRVANADMVANNSRLEQLARQAAEAGLRYCESQVAVMPRAVTIQAANPTPHWSTFTNWTNAGVATTIPEAFMQSSNNGTALPRTLPQCMAEYSPDSSDIVIITSRGFSPDYHADTNGDTESGSVIWLQSIVSLQG